MNSTFFLHGLDSSGNGTKGQFFQNFSQPIECPNFFGTLEMRLQQLVKLCELQTELQFIGSSYGGLMATCFAMKYPGKIAKLVLLAPALNFENFVPPKTPLKVSTLLIIGKSDTVTPPKAVLPLAQSTFSNLEIIIKDDDHMLHKAFPSLNWQDILSFG